jgi:hypothetical protein
MSSRSISALVSRAEVECRWPLRRILANVSCTKPPPPPDRGSSLRVRRRLGLRGASSDVCDHGRPRGPVSSNIMLADDTVRSAVLRIRTRKRSFPDPGSQTHIFESLVTIFGVKSSVVLGKLAQIFFLHFKNKII